MRARVRVGVRVRVRVRVRARARPRVGVGLGGQGSSFADAPTAPEAQGRQGADHLVRGKACEGQS